MYETCTGIR